MRTFVAAVAVMLALPTAAFARSAKPAPTTHECAYKNTGGCGLTITDTVNIFGCESDFYYFNVHRIFLNAGKTYQFTATAVDNFRPDLALSRQELDFYLAQNIGPRRGSATITYTADVSDFYEVFIGPADAGETGSYRLTMICDITPACTPSPTEVCLLDGRFKVSIAYLNQFANPPQPGDFLGAKLVQGTQNPDVATFGISSPQAIEVVVRIQDARPFNIPRFDIYYGGLTDLEYTVKVTDTQTKVTKTYRNPPGTVGGGVDRSTFPAN